MPPHADYHKAAPLFGSVDRSVKQAFNAESYKKARESVLSLLKKEFEYAENDEQKKKIDSGGKDDAEQ